MPTHPHRYEQKHNYPLAAGNNNNKNTVYTKNMLGFWKYSAV